MVPFAFKRDALEVGPLLHTPESEIQGSEYTTMLVAAFVVSGQERLQAPVVINPQLSEAGRVILKSKMGSLYATLVNGPAFVPEPAFQAPEG